MDNNKVKPPEYNLLHKASISFEYLHTNSTTHEFVFGAIAELVDNSRDADAKNLWIDFDKGKKYLSFTDDGVGMTPDELTNVVTFGHSVKKNETEKIGRYGNGLKSGAMRLAKDFIIFTKRASFCSALLLSRTFHETNHLHEILVPTPVFSADGMEPVTSGNYNRHHMEMELIYKYSPFKTEKEFLEQFDKIEGGTGTRVVLFNLRMIENGNFEMDFNTDQYDIQLTDQEKEREEEKNSLRAYLAVLYMNPYMKIHLRGQRVNTIRIFSTLSNPYFYQHNAKNLKYCAEKELTNCETRRLRVHEELQQAKSGYGEMMEKMRKESGGHIYRREELALQRRMNMQVEDLQNLLEECQKKEEAALRAKSKPTPLKFSFGLNIHHRNRYGCMVYNNGRLIDMYVKLPILKENNDILMKCLGVVGVVDISYSILEPTHNKQSFENKREYTNLLKAMNDHMEQYWNDIGPAIGGLSAQAVKQFWARFGYEDTVWSSECDPNNNDAKVRRFQKTHHCIQCGSCLKWRMVPYQLAYLEKGIPVNWTCSKHPGRISCDTKENFNELTVLKQGTLKKKKKSAPEEEPVIKSSPSSTTVLATKSASRKPREPSPVREPVRQSKRTKPWECQSVVARSPAVKKEVEEEVVAKKGEKRARRSPSVQSDDSIEALMGDMKRALSPKLNIKAEDSVAEKSRESSVIYLSDSSDDYSPPRGRQSSVHKRIIISSDDEAEEEEPVVEKRAKTKADARKELEARLQREENEKEVKMEEEEGPEPMEMDSDAQTAADKNLVMANKAKTQLRKMLGTLQNLAGTAGLREFLERPDEDLLDEELLDQAMDDFAETNIMAPKRQIEEAKKHIDMASLRRTYPSDQPLATDATNFMNWYIGRTANPGVERETATLDNCFDLFHDLAEGIARQQVKESDEEHD